MILARRLFPAAAVGEAAPTDKSALQVSYTGIGIPAEVLPKIL